ncbi:Nitroimidazol reductase NimA, pyridoxamine 5'-phosphate oxidase superfamily [Natronoarchaeum philippinense]|uniref:Nitroimidazol reductase NimA, pyridoxamine 5'-phosphate oxidase superfamily n=2 Tax=Natronoarchaeum philippinense TaxID=558529 RepID=A0A285P0F3_NATPI|nr:Nitroimidazol reductase NimA, pyridoxamine 5'-phosphate oxidase superfamily [Natronoarchaeum philippinense]
MTAPPYGVAMTDEEIAAFLERQGHGVLSFGGETPYGLPISFGYDVIDNRCIFQLVSGDTSKKQDYIDASPAVTLVSYDWGSIDNWHSVIIDGEMVEIPDDSPEAVDAADIFAESATAVGLSVFEGSFDDLEPSWYTLQIEEMSGRRAPDLE